MNRLRTYDISDDDASFIKLILEAHVRAAHGEGMAPGVLERLTPVAELHERLVCTAQAFREFHDGASEEDAAFIATLTDDEINDKIGGTECVYSRWAETCDDVLEYLKREKETA